MKVHIKPEDRICESLATKLAIESKAVKIIRPLKESESKGESVERTNITKAIITASSATASQRKDSQYDPTIV